MQNRSDTLQVLSFIQETDKLKSVLRKTKVPEADSYENSAEHSWQVCLLALLLAPYASRPINAQRVVEILLVHDIPEIDTGDTAVYHHVGEAEEQVAAERLFGMLPSRQAHFCLSRWQEYMDCTTDEALFAYAIDRIMPLLHNLNNSGQSWREQKIELERVLQLNSSAIGDILPNVWEVLEPQIQAFEFGCKNRGFAEL